MKIVTSQEMSRIEKLAINEGASEEAFMNEAGLNLVKRIRHLIGTYHLQSKIALLLGRGNNAGDALVAGIKLLQENCYVYACALFPFQDCSNLTQKHWKTFEEKGGKIIAAADKSDFTDADLLVDGIFGTGFKGQVEGLAKDLILKANDSKKIVLSIDIPSGINGTDGHVSEPSIIANETLFLGLPKKGCFIDQAWEYTGKIAVANFGLEEKYIESAKEEWILVEKKDLFSLLPTIKKTRHKYQAGYVLAIAGSFGMTGAAQLASFAALRSGAGIVRLFHPPGISFPNLAWEVIQKEYSPNYQEIWQELGRVSAFLIGPGIGTSAQSLSLLKELFPRINKPCVIDADALTLLAEHDLSFPSDSILTPHRGEMKRLLKLKEDISFEQFIEQCHLFASRHETTLVLKGSPTIIFHKTQPPIISPFGDPGMATAGSGDVLTGILASFLAQGLQAKEAAILGTGIHGLCGEEAAKELTSYSLIASDIIQFIPKIIHGLMKKF